MLGRFERSRRWAHTQSIHACAVQTHVSNSVLCLQIGAQEILKQIQFEVIWGYKTADFSPKCGSEILAKSGDSPESNSTLFQCQEAPGEEASRARIYSKKQLFEQHLVNSLGFLQKKVSWP